MFMPDQHKLATGLPLIFSQEAKLNLLHLSQKLPKGDVSPFT